MKILTLTGILARNSVDPFYERIGSKTRARDTDIFFVAFNDDIVIGSVRFCIEEGTPLLRGMFVAPELHRQGIGKELLIAFEKYLAGNKISNVFCLPHGHLEKFYSSIGFKKIDPSTGPAFLSERHKGYLLLDPTMLMMKRD